MKAYTIIFFVAASIVVVSYGDAQFADNRDEDNFDNHNNNGKSSKIIRKVGDHDHSQHRRGYSTGCSWGKPPEARWHPSYSAGWRGGYCRYAVDCDSPGFDTELECCRTAYAGQVSGHCLSQLPNPPTTSPTGTGEVIFCMHISTYFQLRSDILLHFSYAGGLDVYYPDYESPWLFAGCINRRPMPSGRPTYTSMLACCKGAYGGQVSGTFSRDRESRRACFFNHPPLIVNI